MRSTVLNGSRPGARLALAYLADLERALADADPRQRAETLAAVQERLEDAVAGDNGAEDVRRALDELGPVEAIAAEADSGSPQRSSRWPAVAAALSAGVALVLLVVMPYVAIPLALATLVIGLVQLKHGTESRPLAIATVALSATTLVLAVLLSLTLLSFSSDSGPSTTGPEPTGVESLQE